MIVDAGAEDHSTADGRCQIGPLISRPSSAWASVHLLQTRDVGVYLAQNCDDAIWIVASVDADAGVYVVGTNPDRRQMFGNRYGSGGCSALISRQRRQLSGT